VLEMWGKGVGGGGEKSLRCLYGQKG